ncbi:MAG: lysyl oxidase family protein, partial [Gaiellaceae bacterium]
MFWDCYTSFQGISAGWVDQYHQSTDGQQVDLTGVANGPDYYLVSTTNPTGAFLEQDKTNNTAWVKFTLSTDSSGNRKVTVTATSPCSGALCGDRSTN